MATIEKRVSQEGEVSYRVKVRLKGFPTQTATFERLTDARNWVQNTEAAIREGRHFKNTKSKNKLFAEFIEKYEKEVLASKQKNTANQKLYLKWWKEQLGDYTLADVTPSLIAETRANLVGTVNKFGKKIGTTTANRYTTALGHVYTIALKEWEWVNDNPVRRLSKFKEARGRVRFLSDEERKAILEACKKSENPYLHDIVVLALSTGARKNELVTLKWNQIDLDRGLIILNETKNDERRSLPLRGYALQLLKAIYDKRDKKCEYAYS